MASILYDVSGECIPSISLIRISFGTCLLLYGCERSKVTDIHMIIEDDLKGIPLL